jgi:alpha-aminoadipic semialdehyde synthase
MQSIPRPHTHPSLPSLISSLRALVGDRIASEGTPEALGPVVICVTGYASAEVMFHVLIYIHTYRTGKVAQGALDLLAELPIQRVSVDELPQLVRDPGQ